MTAPYITPDEAEFQAWKSDRKANRPRPAPITTPDEAEYQAWKARRNADAGDVLRENGLLGQEPAKPMRLDVRQPSESTRGQPYDPSRPGDLQAIRDMPRILPWLVKEGARPAASLALTTAQGIPGMESLEAAMGVLGSKMTGNPLSFAESRDALRAESSKMPEEIRTTAKLAGSALALPLVAGLSPAAGGAVIGAADQGLSADQMSLEERLARAGMGAIGGAATGKAIETGGTSMRAAAARPFSKNLAGREDALATLDRQNYGAAARAMSTDGGTSPAIQSALSDPVVVPFVKAVKGTQQFANADDATLLREAYKLMGERQSMLGNRLANSEDFKAGSSLEKADIDAAKKRLLSAADSMGPEFRAAVQAHAKGKGEIKALQFGAKAGGQVMNRRPVATARAAATSGDALRRKAPDMSLEERLAAEEGILSTLKSGIGIQPNVVSLGGALTSVVRPTRVAPLLRALGTPNQRRLDDLIRMSLLGAGALAP